jgi:CobQ-like glutamine amidotransferase family enzyme
MPEPSAPNTGNGRSDAPVLRLGHLYPDQLNMYGDRGNILTLLRRCEWRGIDLRIVLLQVGDRLDPEAFDLLFIGGGQDKEQDEVARDLGELKEAGLRAVIEADMPVLTVCGGYQLLQRFYRPAEGPELAGIGVFDAWTIHRGKKVPRCIGNIAIAWNAAGPSAANNTGEGGERTLVGFENHGGRTYLGPGAQALGRVLAGHGNNSEDRLEGCVYRNTYGTYLHGSLLPKNPHFADHILRLALARSYGAGAAALMDRPVDDRLEWQAHDAMLRRLGVAPRTVRMA